MAVPDFSRSTVDILARRARYKCSNPECGVHTAGPNSDSSKATVIGEAAHIKGAKPDAKRFDPAMSDGERANIANGIWLCRNCHGQIDRDEAHYTVAMLESWRKSHEDRIRGELGARETSQNVPIASIKHDRDVKSMRWLMEALYIPTLHKHINDLPYKITNEAILLHESFSAIVSNPLFSVYDPVLCDAIFKLDNRWQRVWSHFLQYRHAPDGKHFFNNLSGGPLNDHQQIIWDDIEYARREMAEGAGMLLQNLRANYLEIDLMHINSIA